MSSPNLLSLALFIVLKMHEKPLPVKKTSKKHQPKGLTVLHEDQDIIVINKTNCLLTISTDAEKARTAYYILTDYVKKGNPKSRNRIFIVHRLDRDTSGVLVFAKNEQAKRYLQDNWREFSKTYYAVIHGLLDEKEGVITSYLTENTAHRVYSVRDPEKGKLAKTSYKVIKESNNYSLVEINLLTGRKNQIRVHFSEKGHPVVGDKMYGSKPTGGNRLALHAESLTIMHPYSKKQMTFETELPLCFKSLMK